jgi:hypothetical protein
LTEDALQKRIEEEERKKAEQNKRSLDELLQD